MAGETDQAGTGVSQCLTFTSEVDTSMKLPKAQVDLLQTASATDEKTIAELAAETDHSADTIAGAAFALESEGLVALSEATREDFELTAEGREYLDAGLPESRLYTAARELGADESPVPLGGALDEAGLADQAVEVALANYARKEYGAIENGEITVSSAAGVDEDPEAACLDQLAADGSIDEVEPSVIDQLERRGLIERSEDTIRSVTVTDEGVTALMEGIGVAETVDRLTPELLNSGDWQDVEFAEYNVRADAGRVEAGTAHILRQTAERVKDVLVGMGFQEMAGPHADAQFWINDCLFMPQDHPARTHWDQFALDVPPISDLPEDLLERVQDAHRDGVGPDGDGYHSPWDEDVARAVDLRGHTTSLSMRYLSGHQIGDLDPPERFFSVEKVYRNDTLDPTHLLEFFQIEGWVMAEELSVRDLMGTFTEFYEQFGITNLEFKPHYNPYTEPSFELFGEHPDTGELIEIGNSGMFRDEVLRPLGVECDVMAWGLALERLLMLSYGFADIRDVHGTLCDLDLLRETEVVY